MIFLLKDALIFLLTIVMKVNLLISYQLFDIFLLDLIMMIVLECPSSLEGFRINCGFVLCCRLSVLLILSICGLTIFTSFFYIFL